MKKTYLDFCIEFLQKIEKDQGGNLRKAGQVIGDTIMADKLLHVIGTGGHNNIPPFDMFYRAGGLAPVNFIPTIGALYGVAGALHGMRMERLPGYMNRVIDYYKVGKGEVAIIFNHIGVNAAAIDSALECKKRKTYTIGVSSSQWQMSIPKDYYSRHPSRKNLMDIVDLFIDNYLPVGDSVIEFENFDRPIAPISSINDAYIIRRMEIESVAYMLSKGFKPPVFMSANRIEGDEANKALEEKYYNRIKNL